MAAAFTLRIALVLVLCFLVLHGVSGCMASHGHGCFPAESRKMLEADLKVKDEAVKKGGKRENEKLMGWELRTVPSGPDPLHHNGGSPKKPRTDP